jgi:transcriptional regulator with PAS, ATPase and Fis domain
MSKNSPPPNANVEPSQQKITLHTSDFENLIGRSKEMRAVFRLVDTVAGSDGTVLIQGESGTGKELVARAIHKRGPRRDKPFVVINCAAIPATLMESEIFGHTQGAFTGATRASIGKLEIAHRGTVFLDDIDSLEISMQAKLLRVIQEKEFERLGSTKVIKIDVRFVAASNKDLRQLVAAGGFREDLYYRLNVFPIQLPPLRQRRSDIPLLLEHFVQLHAKNSGAAPKQFSTRAVNALANYAWPGNVRELQNLMERLVTVVRRPLIRRCDLNTLFPENTKRSEIPLKDAIRNFEKRYIAEALDLAEDNRSAAARMLGIHRNTLLLKINELGLKKKKPPF